jgi:hypothetical protein
MRNFLPILISIIFCSTGSYSQPRLDFLTVDEWHGQLAAEGHFGFAKGSIWVNDVELAVKTWTDSIIIAAISDSGVGSAGPVVIGALGYKTEPRMLSRFRGSAGWTHAENLHAPHSYSRTFEFTVRADLHSVLRSDKQSSLLFSPQKNSTYKVEDYRSEILIDGRRNTDIVDAVLILRDSINNYESGFDGYMEFAPATMSVKFVINNVKGVTSDHFDVVSNTHTTSEYWAQGLNLSTATDSMIHILPFDSTNGNNMGWDGPFLKVYAQEFLPPKSATQLKFNPTLIAPESHKFIYADTVTLRWDSLSMMKFYRIQLAYDSTFKNIILDSSLVDLQISILTAEKDRPYFWRVAGTNSEGQSKWSSPWQFWISSSASVSSNVMPEFSISPNPIKSGAEFALIGNCDGIKTILLYDALGRQVAELTPIFQTKTKCVFSLSTIPEGLLFIRIQTANGIKIIKAKVG